MTPVPIDAIRVAAVRLLGWPDDYVTIDGAGEAYVGPQNMGEALKGLVRVTTRKASPTGSSVDRRTVIETISGKEYRKVYQSGHDAWNVEITVESFDDATYAGDLGNEIARGLEDEGIVDLLDAAGLSVVQVRGVADRAFEVDTKTLSAAVVDLLVYERWEREDVTAREMIETVTIVGNVGDP